MMRQEKAVNESSSGMTNKNGATRMYIVEAKELKSRVPSTELLEYAPPDPLSSTIM